MPAWTYYFHGCGCCLTHADGTSIDVDFDREYGASTIDPYFYSEYLDSLPAPTGVEALLRRPASYATSWMADLHGLRELGLIEGEHRIRLTERGLRVAAEMDAMAASPSRDAWVPDATAMDARRQKLLGRLTARREPEALLALASLGRAAAEPTVSRVIAEPTIDRLTGTAVALIDSWCDDAHDEQLLLLASRCTSESPPEPHVRSSVIEIVLGRYRADTLPASLRSQLLPLLRAEGHHAEAVVARYLCLLEPEEGLQRLARALHHRVPIVRDEAAAALVVIGAPECAEILRRADTPEARTALELLRGLEPKPGPAPVGEEIQWRGKPRRVYTVAELEALTMPSWIQSITEELTRSFVPLLEKWWSS